MSRLTDELRLSLSIERASEVCRSAIASIGWNIKAMDQHRIVPKIGVGLARNPSNIEVLLTRGNDSQTLVTLNGSSMGGGPFQKDQRRGGMNRLRNAIEVPAAAVAGPGPARPPTAG